MDHAPGHEQGEGRVGDLRQIGLGRDQRRHNVAGQFRRDGVHIEANWKHRMPVGILLRRGFPFVDIAAGCRNAKIVQKTARRRIICWHRQQPRQGQIDFGIRIGRRRRVGEGLERGYDVALREGIGAGGVSAPTLPGKPPATRRR